MPDLAVLLVQSAALIARSAELCTVFRRSIAGGADSNPDMRLVIEALATSAVCLECLVSRTGVPVPRVSDALQQMGTIVAVTVTTEDCAECLRLTQTYQISRNGRLASTENVVEDSRLDAVLTRPRPTDTTEALWHFLKSHRGQLFCWSCLAVALGVAGRLDRVLLTADAPGVRRQHGPCSRCGTARSLCGLMR